MQQQLAPPGRLVVGPIAVRILADVRVEQPGFIAFNRAVAFLELHLAGFGGFDFRSRQNHAGFEALHQEVIVPRLPVVAQDFEMEVFVGQFLPKRPAPKCRQLSGW